MTSTPVQQPSAKRVSDEAVDVVRFLFMCTMGLIILSAGTVIWIVKALWHRDLKVSLLD